MPPPAVTRRSRLLIPLSFFSVLIPLLPLRLFFVLFRFLFEKLPFPQFQFCLQFFVVLPQFLFPFFGPSVHLPPAGGLVAEFAVFSPQRAAGAVRGRNGNRGVISDEFDIVSDEFDRKRVISDEFDSGT